MDSDRLILWIAFNVFVLGMLAIDLGVFHRKAHAVSLKEAGTWSCVWIGLALVFNVGVYYLWGQEKALEFLTGYVIEKSLSVDNLFVFLMIFQYFNTPAEYQHRILFWGIVGALILRAIFIATGSALLSTAGKPRVTSSPRLNGFPRTWTFRFTGVSASATACA